MAQSDVVILPLPLAAEYPEGVAVDPTTGTLYTNSSNTGVVVRMDAATGAATVIGDPLNKAGENPEPPVSVALGLKADGKGKLWVAGARTGSAHIVEIATGKILTRFTTPAGPALLNDITLTPDAAYFTDTVRPILWRAARPAAGDAELEAWVNFEGSAIPYGPDGNLNGITSTPDGRYLIVGHMKNGELFRIDTQTRAITQIATGDSELDGCDGLILDGQRLFVVRQWSGEVVALDLSEDFAMATEVKRIKPVELAWPATVAISGDRLIVANSQLNRRGEGNPTLPFGLVSIPLSAFD